MTTLTKVDITGQWTLVYDASISGPFRGAVSPIAKSQVTYWVGSSVPSVSDAGLPIYDWVPLALSGSDGDKLYAKSVSGGASIVLDNGVGMALVPPWILSSQKENIGRFQVDVGNTGFFDGREFRYFREFDVPVNTSHWIKVVVPADGIILRTQSITLGSGQLRFRAWRNLTIDATFVAPGTPADAHTNDAALTSGLFAQNGLPTAPPYVGLTQITQSGAEVSVSGGTCSEVKRVRTSGATAQQISVGISTADERGIPAGTYYLELQALGTGGNAIGTYDLKYEERIGQG